MINFMWKIRDRSSVLEGVGGKDSEKIMSEMRPDM